MRPSLARGRPGPRGRGSLLALAALACLFAACEAQQQYRLCVVKDDDKNKAVTKYCPMLKGEGSRAECVFGNSRLDCLRLIAKNDADFGVFQAEDILVAMRDRAGDLVVTHDIRSYGADEYEYQLVAIVRKSVGINSLGDLRGTRLCHPGHGYDTDWTEIEGKFFEARVVSQSCEEDLTVRENEIKSSSEFFKAACKAGSWVPDPKFDAELKTRYKNLCELCDSPKSCSKLDKYWGRTGPLLCLTDGFGDVAWARLEDAKPHFGLLSSGTSYGQFSSRVESVEHYSFLCDDGTQQPLNSTSPCSWLVRPWPAIIAQRSAAVGIQKLVASLKDNSNENWQQGIQQLLDSITTEVNPLSTSKVPEDYLGSYRGFLSANSMVQCDRSVKLCTRSNLENAKCKWLSEAAKANGVVPDIVCEQSTSAQNCMELVGRDDVDAVLVESDNIAIAKRKYGLVPILYEHSNIPVNTFNLAAIVPANSPITDLKDLKGKRACFPNYEGAGWNTVIATLKNNGLLPQTCPYENALGMFFSQACVPGLNASHFHQENLNALCNDRVSVQQFTGEAGALECLRSGSGDVAFLPLASVFGTDEANKAVTVKTKDFRPICIANATKECYLSWSMQGQIMVKMEASLMKRKELDMLFKYLNNILGRNKKLSKPIFQMFAPFDGNQDILFHDATERFEDYKTLSSIEGKSFNYEDIMKQTEECSSGFAVQHKRISLILTATIIYLQWCFLV